MTVNHMVVIIFIYRKSYGAGKQYASRPHKCVLKPKPDIQMQTPSQMLQCF